MSDHNRPDQDISHPFWTYYTFRGRLSWLLHMKFLKTEIFDGLFEFV